jgi:hypothetical protein
VGGDVVKGRHAALIAAAAQRDGRSFTLIVGSKRRHWPALTEYERGDQYEPEDPWRKYVREFGLEMEIP